jgi:hypothetical protein
MPDRVSNLEGKKPGVEPAVRRPWVRPSLTRMAAVDAELGTRNTANDGSFTVS